MDENKINTLNLYVQSIQNQIGATAAAVYIIQNDTVINEWYSGRDDFDSSSRLVDRRTQFNQSFQSRRELGIYK